VRPRSTPTTLRTTNQRGYARRFLEDFDGAEKAFKKYISLIPGDPNPYDSYAELLMKMGKFEASIENYRRALKVNPRFAPSHIGIATALNFLGRYTEARKQLKTMEAGARDDRGCTSLKAHFT
jgi:tetratricopeptide (TPR) repeat protein